MCVCTENANNATEWDLLIKMQHFPFLIQITDAPTSAQKGGSNDCVQTKVLDQD